jgi:acetoin utilization deacetylase AcuC-like enzyme
MILDYLRRVGYLDNLTNKRAPMVSFDDILSVHSPYLLDSVRVLSELGSGVLGESAYASPGLLDSALLAVGGAAYAAELVVNGKFKHTLSIMRPPGHHASRSNPSGLCYFNNIAIAVRKVQESESVKRVSIIDTDDHFGNGTSEIFYADPSVQYIGLHEYDYEMFGVGHYDEIGYGEGIGTNVNIPLLEGASDASYLSAFERIVTPAVEKFSPDLIGVSLGLDTHYADPVGNMNLDTSSYYKIGQYIDDLTERTEAVGSFSVLEGGYNPMLLGPSIQLTIDGLAGIEMKKMEDQIERVQDEEIAASNEEIISTVLSIMKKCW